eukprot:6463739-Amphidinium_carterae.1
MVTLQSCETLTKAVISSPVSLLPCEFPSQFLACLAAGDIWEIHHAVRHHSYTGSFGLDPDRSLAQKVIRTTFQR